MADPQTEQTGLLHQPPPVAGGRFTWPGLAVGGLGGVVIGLLWAWWAEMGQSYVAPLVLAPLLIGAGVGISVVALVRIAQLGHRPTMLSSVVLAAVIAAAGQHYILYLAADSWLRSPFSEQLAGQHAPNAADAVSPSFGHYICAQVNRGRPLFFDYVAHGWMVWLTWVVDGLLTLVAAVAIAVPAMHTPYCDRCQSWYRVVRNGKIDEPTAQRLAELVGVVLPDRTRSRRYRMSSCHSGCSPTCCELSWEDAMGGVSLVQFWLDAVDRNRMAAILDQVASEIDEEE